ncbi:Retrovirus-related Pol polyprotein from transposon RE1, partial [Linum perenne]
ITSIKLSNDNYHTWSRAITVALSIKNKLQFINGTSSMPDPSDTSYAVWIRCNFAVLSWILNSVSDDIAQSLISYDNAASAWNDLKQRFSQCDAIRVADLQSRISSCDQGNATVTQYFTNLKVLWEEFLQYRHVPACECNPGQSSKCNVVSKMMLYQEQDYVIRFIRGLNDSFDVVRSQLLLMDPLPDVNTMFKFVVQLERQMRGAIPRSVDSVALAAAAARQFRGKGADEGLFCRYCKKDNYTIENCYRLKNKKARENGNGIMKTGNARFAGSVIVEGNTSGDHTTSDIRSTSDDLSGTVNMTLSSVKFARLKAPLQQPASSSSTTNETYANLITQPIPSPNGILQPLALSIFTISSYLSNHWIIDTGASRHIACSISIFLTHKPLVDTHVTLPTGDQVLASHIGVVSLPCGLTLHDVLLVPSFTFNLLSISCLTKHNPVSVIFLPDQCHILDRQSQKMIGLAQASRGLYLLPAYSTPMSLCSFPSTYVAAVSHLNLESHSLDLWHCRLGHPSLPRLQLLHQTVSSITPPTSSHCITCHLAKQKTLPFNKSASRAAAPFGLVHMDIWGPLNTKSHDGFSYFLTVLDDHTRCVWTFLMKNKGETCSLIQSFCSMVSTQFSTKVKIIRSDQGLEFRMDSFFSTHGILHQTSCVSIVAQKGRV